jgi:Transposase DDE domain
MIFPEALPQIKIFLKPVSLGRGAQALLIRCLVAFLMHFGRMSASQAAGAVRTQARHRAQISRFLGRSYWKRTDLLGPLRAALLELEAQQDGLFIFDVDQTFCGSQGRCRENTFRCGNYRKRPRKSHRKQKKTARRSAHGFVMGLLITPSGLRIPFSTPFYTKEYCQKTKRDFHTQAELAARLIRQLPVPEGARVVVLGDTAFEAQSIRAACAERRWSWIMPVNPERVLAGAKPRPKVTSLAKQLHADQMVRLEVHPTRGKYVIYRRVARCRIGPKLKPRTYYVHQESREVHSVGKVQLVFSTTNEPTPGHAVDVQKILMTNDESLSAQDVIELYQLRWQIEMSHPDYPSSDSLYRRGRAA